jgi:Flp pilus assembly protein TadG
MILVAVCAGVIMGIAGLAVEGGQMMVQYRQMQTAADMAALVGAQDAGCRPTDTSCINTVKQSACTSAQANGFGGGWDATNNVCLAGSNSTVTIDVPPQTCSPYNLNYGNSKTPSNNCAPTTSDTPSTYNYVEVEIQTNLGTVPFFNVSVSPYSHAVARRGTQSPRDFAIAMLDYNLSSAIDFEGSAGNKALGTCGICVVGSIMSNSTASVSIKAGGSGTTFTCGGQWYTASNLQSSPYSASNQASYTLGSTLFSPPGCAGTQDSTVAWNWGEAKIADPYGSFSAPPTTQGWSSCATCGSPGHYYHWTTDRNNGTWDEGGAGTPPNITKDNWEFFPGTYSGQIQVTGSSTAANVYFNPGVYNIAAGGLKITGGTICVFGAPVCDDLNGTPIYNGYSCFNGSMDSTKSSYVPPSTWYYYCSPWGTWDTSAPSGNNSTLASTLKTEIPYFTYGNSPTTRPLNGVTFYSYTSANSLQNSATVQITGGGGEVLAFPNPCPGTASSTAANQSVPFQVTMGTGDSGSTAAQYTYPAGSAAYSLGSSPMGNVYPSADLTVSGEETCRATLNNGDASGAIPDTWPNESPSGGTSQLLQFLFFLRSTKESIQLAGGGNQTFWGILYNPGDSTYTSQCGASTSNCQISLSGSGGGTGDIPMMIGQIIGDGVKFSGSTTMEVFYRPCDPRSSSCEQGPGSKLVQ